MGEELRDVGSSLLQGRKDLGSYGHEVREDCNVNVSSCNSGVPCRRYKRTIINKPIYSPKLRERERERKKQDSYHNQTCLAFVAFIAATGALHILFYICFLNTVSYVYIYIYIYRYIYTFYHILI